MIIGAEQSAAGVVTMSTLSAGQSAHHLYGKVFFKNEDDDDVCGGAVYGGAAC